MPVFEMKLPRQTSRDAELVLELVSELRNPKPSGQPVIEIREVGPNARHVTVIWDKWDACNPQIRPKIIREAFANYRDPEFEKTIAVAMAATVEEAIDLGMLPFEVKPYRWYQLKEEQKGAYRQALTEEGAIRVGSGQALTLRFRTLDEAEAAVARLRAKEPSIEWGIVQSLDSPD